VNVVLPTSDYVTQSAISVDRLQVAAGDFTVELADWHIAPGSCVALIGPNGAGKTTLLETMLGLRKAIRLEGKLLGHPIQDWQRRPALRQQLGALLQRTQLPFGLRVGDVVKLHRGLYQRTSPTVLEALGIPALEKLRYDRLSTGQTQRTELFMALAHEPELIVLDEPFNGLDAQFASATAGLLRGLEKSTILMSCHSPGELAVADVVLWMQDGRARASRHPDLLRRELLGDFRLQVVFETDEARAHFDSHLHSTLRPNYVHSESPLQLSIFGDEALVRLAQELVQDVSTTKLEFGRTTLADLLYRCAQKDENV
jgi:ABC-2 type transport system ATP-binding protein